MINASALAEQTASAIAEQAKKKSKTIHLRTYDSLVNTQIYYNACFLRYINFFFNTYITYRKIIQYFKIF